VLAIRFNVYMMISFKFQKNIKVLVALLLTHACMLKVEWWININDTSLLPICFVKVALPDFSLKYLILFHHMLPCTAVPNISYNDFPRKKLFTVCIKLSMFAH